MNPAEPSRVRRPALVRARWYRWIVPAAVIAVGAGTLIVLALAAGVLLGIVPYPGR